MEEIKKILKEKNLTIGTERTLKRLRAGKLKKIFLSSNCPENVSSIIERYAKLSEIGITRINLNNEELGILCKRPHHISVISY